MTTEPNNLTKYASADEAKVARKLVKHLIKQGLTISVNDGEETTVKRSTKAKQVIDALATTGEDTLIIHTKGLRRVGTIYMIYNNGETSPIADHTATDEMGELLAPIDAYADSLER